MCEACGSCKVIQAMMHISRSVSSSRTSRLMDAMMDAASVFLDRVRHVDFKSLLLAALPFLLYLFVFKYYAFLRDYTGMSALTQPNRHILPKMEEAIFQCLPHKVLSAYPNLVLDLMAAVPYLIHFPLPVMFAVYLGVFTRRRRHVYGFLWCAGWVNFLAVIVQFVFPTAPPWFTDSAVFDAAGNLVSSAPNEAGFQRLDQFFGVQMFHNIYSASPVKFGAMPSLHVAWPAIILFCKPWISVRVGVVHLVWIVWAALYSNHHYGVDALAGIALALLVNLCMVRIWCPFDPPSIFAKEDDEIIPTHIHRTRHA